MATGSTLTGRWRAIRIVPPEAAEAGGVLAPDVGAVLLPPPVLAAGLAVPPPQAAMMALIDAIESPITVPRPMNSRRLSRPLTNASTVSSCRGVVDLRTLSSSE